VVRLCLKHFRQHNYQEAFESLQRHTQVQLEDPVLSQLHDILVTQGDYEGTEHFMEHSVTRMFFFCVTVGLIFSALNGALTFSWQL
jgi:hypothetical protein